MDSTMESGFEVLGGFDLEEFLRAEPEETTSFDITRKVPIDAGFLCCGDGSFGSEGFCGQLDGDGELKWVVYLEECNPFVEIAVEGEFATFRSSSGVWLRINFKDSGN
ncbi:hypothetical protein [Saccharopolyspora flava]|uniref:hypothetical protein n=1 Tax=Saccharopolyspora flava TaxID=95161 RepID=UPI001114DBBB|nr:hypothetical protein [Saccharopolyspora flava]